MAFRVFFKKEDKETKKEEVIVEEVAVPESVQMHEVENNLEGDMAKDLMVRIGYAIDEWAAQYGMEKLPKHIVFEQALAVMNAWDKVRKKTK